MTKKLIMFDIDGTLLDHDKQLPASAKEAIYALKEKGHEVAIATGRAPYFINDLRKELEIDSFICFNGQYVEIESEAIYKNPIDKMLLVKLLELANSYDHPLVYMGGEALRSTVEKHAHVEESFGTLEIGVTNPVKDAYYFNQKEVFQTLLYCTASEESVYREAFPELTFIRWHEYVLDVLPAGGSKANGIEQYMNRQGYKKEDVYAFGDNLNDVEMLQFVGHGVAMGNAPETVKEIAKYVTKDVDDGGIRHGLEMVGLL